MSASRDASAVPSHRRAPSHRRKAPQRARSHRGSRRRRRKKSKAPLLSVVGAVLAAVGGGVWWTSGGVDGAQEARMGEAVSATSIPDGAKAGAEGAVEPTPAPSATPTPTPTLPLADPRPQRILTETMAAAFAKALPRPSGEFALGVRDVETGAFATAGDIGHRFPTASIVKPHILAALLLKAQEEGRDLTAVERGHASPMIRKSANDATDALWDAVGQEAALNATYARLGLTETTSNRAWGLTETSVTDQVRFVAGLYDEDSPLDADSRAYLLELMSTLDMGNIVGGVHTVADRGTRYPAKDGWLPRDADGRWVINSYGRISVKGRLFDVAFLSEHQVNRPAGAAQGDAALRAVLPAVSRALTEAEEAGEY
ncbi:serine hydrolase (plasmid) [Streptomyces sp. BI20]|uniref:serine hydrolase n=1 Tax=Streptomyces sp. BI20 TaxID=3403460 RepID=UPI003C7264B3